MGRLADGAEYPAPEKGAKKRVETADARDLPFDDDSVHLVVTSPPYWQKRDYGFDEQIGQEETAEDFIDTLCDVMDELERVLHPTGSAFVNLGDTYDSKSLVDVPGVFKRRITEEGWLVRNDIIWAKDGGMPDPATNRLANRHEHILHVAPRGDYYYDLFGYEQEYSEGVDAGDVWTFGFDRNTKGHLAPFPEELVRRAVILAAPPAVCSECNNPYERTVERTAQLDESRPQARRAMEIYERSDLTEKHIRAIRSVGITDVGKAQEFQDGTGRNADEVEELAEEAKAVLGGYFREFTYPQKESVGWEATCDCDASTKPGVVLDPFIGTGTTAKVALDNGLSAYGTDLDPPDAVQVTFGKFTN